MISFKIFFENFIKKYSRVEDFLIWEPEGPMKKLVDFLNQIPSKEGEMYRGMSLNEYKNLKNHGLVKSREKGVTNKKGGTYLTKNSKLSGRFALVAARDTRAGVFIILDEHKLPNLEQRNEWDWVTEYIPWDAVKSVYILKKNGEIVTD